MLLAWLAWRVGLDEAAAGASAAETAAAPVTVDDASGAAATAEPAATAAPEEAAAEPPMDDPVHEPVAPAGLQPSGDDARMFPRRAQRRLARWHRQIVAAWKSFDELEEEDLHTLRKRIKRQRYAVEFFAPVLRRRDVERYLERLMSIQERMGEMNDLFVARTRYQALVGSDPAAWFALGWLAARLAQVRELTKPELKLLAKTDPPGR
jgi:hypothetical protein